MAINSNLIRRPSDKNLFLVAAISFPLLVLIGYFKTYYFKTFFDVPPIANSLVHFHALVMSAWVLYFVAQFALIRTKNIKLHISMGFAGIALAALVIIVGMATAYNSHLVRNVAPMGVEAYKFFIIPTTDMFLFILFFGGAIYFRKRPAEHKTLMLMTAINFSAAAIARIPVVPEQFILPWAFGMPMLIALICLGWHTWRNRKINKVFAFAVFLFITSVPLRILISETAIWQRFTTWLSS